MPRRSPRLPRAAHRNEAKDERQDTPEASDCESRGGPPTSQRAAAAWSFLRLTRRLKLTPPRSRDVGTPKVVSASRSMRRAVARFADGRKS